MFLAYLTPCIALLACVQGFVTIEGNGYSGVVVAISNDIPEDKQLIDNIQDMFSEASDYLYLATRRRAYFRDVTIVVPKEWTAQTYFEPVPPDDRFSRAEIRVDKPNPAYGNNPYTLQPGGCGDPGEYIHLTPEFVKELRGITQEEFGPPGRILVHEWAHLRYGVFDEYSENLDTRLQKFYVGEKAEIHPTGCTADIKGWILYPNGERCALDGLGLPDRSCQFYPDPDGNINVKGSIMNMPFLDSVLQFCDDNDVPHNPLAPNRHNLLCQGRSTWSVIIDHPDFADNRNPERYIENTTPNFRLIQPRLTDPQKFVLMLDMSTSMTGSRMMWLHFSVTRFIRQQLPMGSLLGIVGFSNDSSILLPLTQVTHLNKPDIIKIIPNKALTFSNTAIGRGLQTSIRVLSYYGGTTEGARIILVTDGEENVTPEIKDVLGEVLASKTVINTVAFGDRASKKLEELARISGGKSFYMPDSPSYMFKTDKLDAAFYESVTYQADVINKPIQVIGRYHTVFPSRSIRGNITIDQDVGKNTKIIFSGLLQGQSFAIDVTLSSPSKNIYNSRSPEYFRDDYSKRITFAFNKTKKGKWMYEVRNLDKTRKEPISVTVFSEPKSSKAQPIRIRSWMSSIVISYPAAATVYAEVKKGYRPVLNATVMALVDRPNNHSVKFLLSDNGVGADTIPNDGIYSAYFTEFSGNGRYQVTATVISNNETVLLEGYEIDDHELLLPGSSAALKKKNLPKISSALRRTSRSAFGHDEFVGIHTHHKSPVPITTPVKELERTSVGGTWVLENFTRLQDLVPPLRVTDLQVVNASQVDGSIELQWTSAGDNADKGLASQIDLRMSTQPVMYTDFENATRLNESHVIEGTLVPEPPGYLTRLKLKVPFDAEELYGKTIYVSIVTVDHAGNRAQPSNVIATFFSAPVNKAYQIEKYLKLLSGYLVLGVVGITVLSILITGLVLNCLRKRKRRRLQVSFS